MKVGDLIPCYHCSRNREIIEVISSTEARASRCCPAPELVFPKEADCNAPTVAEGPEDVGRYRS